MEKLISGISMLLLTLTVLAADDEAAAVAPRVEADPTGLILFALVFVGLIGGYAYVIWRSGQKKKDSGK